MLNIRITAIVMFYLQIDTKIIVKRSKREKNVIFTKSRESSLIFVQSMSRPI